MLLFRALALAFLLHVTAARVATQEGDQDANTPMDRLDPHGWQLVSQGRPVSVQPPSATCGYRRGSLHGEPGQGPQPSRGAGLSLPAALRAALLVPTAGSTSRPGGDPRPVLSCTNRPCPDAARAGHLSPACGAGPPCIVDLDLLGCPSRYTVTFSARIGEHISHRFVIIVALFDALFTGLLFCVLATSKVIRGLLPTCEYTLIATL